MRQSYRLFPSSGVGAAALYHLMEDAATAEISRTQIWLWLQKNIVLEDGKPFTPYLLKYLTEIELIKIKQDVGELRYTKGRFELAADLFTEMSLRTELDDFLTTIAYKYL